MIKYIYLGIVAIVVFTLNFIFGSVISWFLSITLLTCIVFFVLQLGLENTVNNQLKLINNNNEKGYKLYQFGKKWESILKFFGISIVFIASVICIQLTMHPQNKDAWFLNNEYHGLSNTGITFNKQLSIYKSNNNEEIDDNGAMHISNDGQNARIQFNDFFTPVFIYDKKEATSKLINNIVAPAIQQSFSISNPNNSLDVTVTNIEPSFLKKWFSNDKDHILYTIQLTCNDDSLLNAINLKAPYQDKITIEGNPLKKGMLLFDALLDGYKFEATKEESYLILEHILLGIENTYLLANHTEDNILLNIFPSKALINLGYQIKVDGKNVPYSLSNASAINIDQDFYIGFNNQKKLLKIGQINGADYGLKNETTNALLFDYPNTYTLKSPGKQTVGNKNIRSITNNYENIINDDIKEGFFFTTYNLNIKSTIQGAIDYVSGPPNSALAIALTDYNLSSNNKTVENNKFGLITENQKHHYLFAIRDFSDNGFSPENSIIYLSIIYVAFLILLVYFPGKNLERIETIILSVVLALITIRIIMYWRVATFPPLEQISKYELENTLINFDFSLGMQLPLPLTVIWPLIFTLVIIAFRHFNKEGKSSFTDKYLPKLGKDSKTLNKQYLSFLIICMALHLINSRIIHFDAFTRIITIIIPLIGYCFFSIRNNYYYQYHAMQVAQGIPKWLQTIKAYFYYFINNPTAVITLATIVYFGLFDRGFAILFVLFLLLKNILINLTKKSNTNKEQTIAKMLIKPYNYWIFGFISLAAYLTILSFKSLFYYILTYKIFCIGLLLVLLCIAIIIIYGRKSKIFKIGAIATVSFVALMAIPAVYSFTDQKLDGVVKHVMYRASIINQPISALLQENEYASFKTRKIIETAENQWFINSYISKKYDNDATINLRAHSKIGVDYPTQTRDVVLARYVISEMGNFVMYLILLLILLPMVLYLISFELNVVGSSSEQKKNNGSYAGLLPLLLLFTIALFVWLTATNRFVFFGQDFPFLSLTSKISVLLPLLLYGITLIYKPSPKHSFNISIKDNAIKYALFTGLIAIFALTTIKQNELNNENFSVVMQTTQDHIDNNLNIILASIQDSLTANGENLSYQKLINTLKTDRAFDSLVNEVVEDKYTASILKNLVEKPASAFELNNPLFMIYDNGTYTALYNKNLFLELPPIENRNLWQGNIMESIVATNTALAVVTNNAKKQTQTLPYFSSDPLIHYQFAILPKNWFVDAAENVGILNITNASNAKQNTSVFIYKNSEKNMVQNGTSYATTINNDDIITLYNINKSIRIGFNSEGNRFASNKWINGTYKIIYPLRANNFWIYNFAHAIRNTHSTPELLNKNINITLDYELGKQIQNSINEANSTKGHQVNRRFAFSVIGADGDGNVRFMSDFSGNRIKLDPNDEASIFNMQQKQFFYSNARNERDQWGNKNLLNMYLGPGSSIKPLIAATVASQLNAGWEFLQLQPSGAALNNYAGLKFVKPWKNTDHGAPFSLRSYIEKSSNIYESVMLFLGSYSKQAFLKDNTYNLKNLLVTNPGANNNDPRLNLHGISFYLPNYNGRKGNWPASDQNEERKSFFGNNNSLLANGLEKNANLRTTDKDKLDASAFTTDKVNFVDSTLFKSFKNAPSSSFLWSFPEESYFLQAERAHKEIHQNFNIGLKTATLGGYPMKITPFKMNEMYLSMANLNPALRLNVIHQNKPKASWQIDETWKGMNNFKEFMAQYIMAGMHDVIFGAGTITSLRDLKGKYPNLHFYAKTGTINEELSGQKSSKRLIVIIADKDLTVANNLGNAKTYALYFTSDQTHSFDIALLKEIIGKTIESKSFKYYFNK